MTTLDQLPPPLPAIPVTLEYAPAVGVCDDPQLVRYARQSTLLAVLSGLCIAVCFLPMMRFPGGTVIHLAMFAGTIYVALKCGATMTQAAGRWPVLRSPVRTIFDIIALSGLLVIAVAPLALISYEEDPKAWQLFIAGGAFLAMALTAFRHVLLYRALASICADLNWRGLRLSFVSLGYFKLCYETLWLLCCALPLLIWGAKQAELFGNSDVPEAMIFVAFGAFFGCMGYTAVWIWMIIAHARLISLTRIGSAR